jgi:hypothetical protein
MTLAEFASKGGKARARNQTAEQRREQARKAANERWRRWREKKESEKS